MSPRWRTRGWAGGLLLALASGLSTLLALDGLAWVYLRQVVDPRVIVLGDRHWDHGHVPDPDLNWRLAPGVRIRDAWPGVDVETNSLGFRGPEVSLAPPHARFRVVVVGESQAFGHGVRAEEAWPAVLEREIDWIRPDLGFEVVNAAVRAWTVWQGMRWAERDLPSLRADLLLASFEGNDGMPTAIRNGEDIRRWLPYTDKEVDLLTHGHSLPPAPPLVRATRWFYQRTHLGMVLGREMSPYALRRVPRADRFEAWLRMARAAEAAGTRLVMVHPVYWYPCRDGDCLLRELAWRGFAPLVDPDRVLAAEGIDPPREYIDPAHPRPAMHARIAAAVAGELLPLIEALESAPRPPLPAADPG